MMFSRDEITKGKDSIFYKNTPSQVSIMYTERVH